jgi:Holliday junction resolvase RusA-like endonuclease
MLLMMMSPRAYNSKGKNEMLVITIPGKPIPLKRHRTTSTGHTYNPQQEEMETTFWVMSYQMPKNTLGQVIRPFEGPLKVHFDFFMEIPASTPKLKKPTMVGIPHFKKPDADNMIKFYSDAGNSCIWKDDSQIAILSAKKVYDVNPRTVITIEVIDTSVE